MDVLTATLSSISLVATIIGLIKIGNIQKSGFVWFSISLMIQAYLFIQISNWFLLVQMVVLIGFNIKNYLKWKREGN